MKNWAYFSLGFNCFFLVSKEVYSWGCGEYGKKNNAPLLSSKSVWVFLLPFFCLPCFELSLMPVGRQGLGNEDDCAAPQKVAILLPSY